jgi:hypothetical protein
VSEEKRNTFLKHCISMGGVSGIERIRQFRYDYHFRHDTA